MKNVKRFLCVILYLCTIKCASPGLTAADYDDMPLAFTEIMYRFSETDTLEYVEIRNVCDVDVELKGIRITGGIDFQFGPEAPVLSSGAYMVVTNSTEEYRKRYPNSPCAGPFTGRLANEGESIELISPFGSVITEMSWDNELPWPVLADGRGYSLVSIDDSPVYKQDYHDYWRNSADTGGSPGFTDPSVPYSKVLINEFKPNWNDSGGFIELFNGESKIVDITGWLITTRKDFSEYYTVKSNAVMKPGGFFVIKSEDAPELDFRNAGQCIFLLSALNGKMTGYCSGMQTSGAVRDKSIGILEDRLTVGPLSQPTPGKHNDSTVCSRHIIISELMYHPSPGNFEFLEITNLGDTAVVLGTTPYMPFSWKVRGVDFTFPQDMVIGAEETILLVNANDSTLFKEKYRGNSVQVFFYSGKLSNKGETVSIAQPVDSYVSESGEHKPVYANVDQITYDDRRAWAAAADGEGYSLVRVGGCGPLPKNWKRSEKIGGNPGEVQ